MERLMYTRIGAGVFFVLAGFVAASAEESYTCKFSGADAPCQQTFGKTCQHTFEASVHVTCGNLQDAFMCVFSTRPWGDLASRPTLLARAKTDALALSLAD